MSTVYLSILNQDYYQIGPQFRELSKLVSWVNKNKVTPDGLDVRQQEANNQTLTVDLKTVLEIYNGGETPEDLYFF